VIFLAVMILTLVITFVESIYEVYFRDEGAVEAVDENVQRRLKRLMVGH
jgi:uncharacterized membrane protein